MVFGFLIAMQIVTTLAHPGIAVCLEGLYHFTKFIGLRAKM